MRPLHLLLSCITIANGTLAGPVDFAAPIPANFQIQPLPGHAAFVFTIYGAPAELESVKQIV
jgi:hypothetical protein